MKSFTYTFSDDGKRITLAPLSSSQLDEPNRKITKDIRSYFLLLVGTLLKASYHEFKVFN